MVARAFVPPLFAAAREYTHFRMTETRFTLPIELPDIKRILPHRHPFLLVDRIGELE